jgi:hypothetical protein
MLFVFRSTDISVNDNHEIEPSLDTSINQDNLVEQSMTTPTNENEQIPTNTIE